MAAIVEFKWDSRDLAVWRGGKVEAALTRAMRLAGNQALKVLHRETVAYVLSKKWLKADFVESRLKQSKPSTKTALRDLEWAEHVSGKGIELSRFPAIQTARGVSVRVNKGAGTTRIRSAFIATNRRQHEGVFLRRGKARLPIKELRTSRVSDVMSDAQAAPLVLGKALERFESAFARGMAREAAKLRRKGDL